MKILIRFVSNTAVIIIGMIMLAGCGGEGSSNPKSNSDYFQNSSLAPSLALYGFGDSSFVSNVETVTLNGGTASPSGKQVTLSYTLNGVADSYVPIDAQGMFSITAKLKPGENTIVLKLEETQGLVSTKEVILSYEKYSTIAKDLYLSTNSIGGGQSKTIIANIGFSSVESIKSVNLQYVKSNNVIGVMHDDGALPDEISADGLFSVAINHSDTIDNGSCFKASITLKTGDVYFSGIKCLDVYLPHSLADYDLKTAMMELIEAKYNSSTKSLPTEKAIDVINKIKANDAYETYFSDIKYDFNGSIYFKLRNGLEGFYRNAPLGTIDTGSKIESPTSFLLAPYDSEFGANGQQSFSGSINSEIFDIMEYSINIGSPKIFNDFKNAGLLNIYTHGGNWSGITNLGTNESVATKECEHPVIEALLQFSFAPTCYDISKYKDDIDAGRMDYTADHKYVITVKYLSEYSKNIDFKNSLVFMTSCHTAENSDLRDFFFQHGAAGFIGYQNSVMASYASKLADEFYKQMMNGYGIKEALSLAQGIVGATDKSYRAASNKEQPAYAQAFLKNNIDDLFIPDLSLYNGDFESNSTSPWGTSGDARAISQLAEFVPVGGKVMGIISTGLGYTKNSGSLTQKVLIQNTFGNLMFSWNFLSEEFLEYCGSIYQDYFTVSACKSDGACDILFTRKVDDLCSAVAKSNAIFDVGDVYATGWSSQSIDISSYRGKVITLKFEASDIGDSDLDTAILLDEIRLE